VWVGLIAWLRGNLVQCFAEFESGTWDDAVYRCPLVIPAGATSGVWRATLWASNPSQRVMSVHDVRDAGGVSEISVSSPDEDLAPPVLTGFSFAPDTVTAGDAVTVEVSFTDAGVGAEYGGAWFNNSTVPNVLIGCSSSARVAGTAHAGTFRCTFTISSETHPGTWVAGAQLGDHNFNAGYTDTPELQAAGYPTTLVVLPPGGG
jgi:hypothetical protein